VNEAGQKLAEFLDAEPNARESGVVELGWTFPDGSAVVFGQANCRALSHTTRRTAGAEQVSARPRVGRYSFGAYDTPAHPRASHNRSGAGAPRLLAGARPLPGGSAALHA
jgi:hypothetical protein